MTDTMVQFRGEMHRVGKPAAGGHHYSYKRVCLECGSFAGGYCAIDSPAADLIRGEKVILQPHAARMCCWESPARMVYSWHYAEGELAEWLSRVNGRTVVGLDAERVN